MNTHSSQTTHTQMDATNAQPRPQQFKEYTDKYSLLGVQRCDMILDVNGDKNTEYGVKSGKKQEEEEEEEEEEFEEYDENKQYICCDCKRDFTDECDDRSSFENALGDRKYICADCGMKNSEK
jgi:hypothetical protein